MVKVGARRRILLLGAAMIVSLVLCHVAHRSYHPTKRTDSPYHIFNILHIIVDDLRPQLGAYEGVFFPTRQQHEKMATVHMDRLAAKSAVFLRAYSQYALCTPSRTSFLTGRRPLSTMVHAHKVYFRDKGVNFTTIPGFFRDNGYVSAGTGKIFQPLGDTFL